MSEVEELMDMILNQPNKWKKAIKKLKKIKGKKSGDIVLEKLLEIAKDPFYYKERENAILALGELGDRRAVDMLLNLLKEGSSQRDADKALQELMTRGPLFMSRESSMINRELPEIRAAAAQALGLIGDKRALHPLIDTVQNDWAYPPRAAAAWALGELGDKSAVPVLKILMKTEQDEIVLENVRRSLKKL